MHLKHPGLTAPAVLKTPEGKLLEVGEAVVSPEQHCVDFYSEFVQVCKMGTPLEIVIIQGDDELQAFRGNVYLSTQNMLRLVDVSDEVLPGARSAYLCEVSLSGIMRADTIDEVRGGFLMLGRKTMSCECSFPITLHRLSMRALYFTSDKKMHKGQLASLSLSNPPARNITLEIEKVFDFGQELTNYHCRIVELDKNAKAALYDYLGDLCGIQFKLF